MLLLSAAHMIFEQGQGVSVETSVTLWSIRAQSHYCQWCHSKVKPVHVRGELDTCSCWSCAPAECLELILVPWHCSARRPSLKTGTGTNFFICKPGKLLSSALAFLAHLLLCWPSSEAVLVRSKTRLAALLALSRGQPVLLRQAVQCLKRLGQGTCFGWMGFMRSSTWPVAPADRAGTSSLVEPHTAHLAGSTLQRTEVVLCLSAGSSPSIFQFILRREGQWVSIIHTPSPLH